MNISASVYAANPLYINSQITALLPDIESLHFDVMDGHFVPAYGLNITLFQQLKENFDLPIDVHLMVTNPEEWALSFAQMGARYIAVHPESCRDPVSLLRAIRQRGAKGYLAISTSLSMVDVQPLIAEADGGEFIPEMLHKAQDIPADLPVVYDGRMQKNRFHLLRNQPHDQVVIGSALFNSLMPEDK
ncbi:TPA: hypothetical protein RY491_003464 [Escherichia albertii]|uniref:hypothetical protein n=1 Tax=Escherichia albertii TaxID=208962 RepID=UPI000C80104C|nr:hypothetical protein [Escherichia albertii]MCV3220120.1 hypothetical protein [Escherichia albertii]MCV3223449.1 hypothetical protein [Escherichia albertii]MCV3235064.1 hypothetical protein [Escherichia albertii]MCV3246563.1 hypothetical protein [Escherichia albertii]MCV3260227.1 hypothetical protein [Escherichia albertii]